MVQEVVAVLLTQYCHINSDIGGKEVKKCFFHKRSGFETVLASPSVIKMVLKTDTLMSSTQLWCKNDRLKCHKNCVVQVCASMCH